MVNQKEQLEQHDINELLSSFYSGLLIYPDNEERNEYLSFDESIQLLDIPPHKFNDLIVSGSLKPCFPWSGYLEVKRKISVYEYRKLFYSDSSADDFANNFIEEPDVLVRAYVNFNGYVRPVESAHYLDAILVGESKKIAVEDVYLIENLTLDSVVHIIGNHGEAPKKVIGKNELFCKDHEYKIYQGMDNNDIDIKSYVFLKDDIGQFVKESQKIEIGDVNEKIKADLLALRKRQSGRVNDNSKKTRTYTEVPKLIIELNYQLNALPHVKEINDKNGRDGLRAEVKQHMQENYKELHEYFIGNKSKKSTFDQYWTDLMDDIKEIVKYKYN
ncbi:hypothetical protein [Acinetobacter baumannii]|uniref:hypothetical protein n=1 Tax=Acinetobacter baumannii TaxID=470 RepID=UPI0013607AA7|nr:hypothetical protein [Acinetobacter baumannii]MDC4512540.1 hypothetical protein [Acinetobacter baumannii]MDC5098704.1 hypothetical protein [Acinetobacter baumannii]CAA0224485.1 hypothetical protein AB945B12_02000 [Acinetobacter baumannii]